MNSSDDPIETQAKDDEHGEHLLDLLLRSGVMGACAGGLVTLLTLVPARTLLSNAPLALPLAHCLLTACTSAVLLSGLAYLARRAVDGRLDHSVGRALPLVFLLLVPMIAPWTRLVVAFPRFVEASFAVSFATGLIAFMSLLTTFRTTNRVSAIFAAINACEYGMLSAGLAMAGGAVALAGLSTAAAATCVMLCLQEGGAIDPGFLGGASRTVSRVAILAGLVAALGFSSLSMRVALTPIIQQLDQSHGASHGEAVLLRGAVVTVSSDGATNRGCRPVDDPS